MMNKHFTEYKSLFWMFLAAVLLLAGCSDDTNNNSTTTVAKKTRPPVKKAVVEHMEEVADDAPLRFVYSPTGRRDPFEPLVKKGAKTRTSNVPLTPLQRFDLGQYRLQAVLIGKGVPRAMVSAPDGKTYILSPGIKIGKREGVVTAITRESVQIEEIHYGLTGEVSRKFATIDMPEQKSF